MQRAVNGDLFSFPFKTTNSLQEHVNGAYEFRVDDELCIGYGFCAGACPSGIWRMVPNLIEEMEKQ